MTTDLDFDDAPLEENELEIEADEEEVAPRRNPLRIILLALLVLVLLCVVCYLASWYINIPGISPTPTATATLAPTEEPTGEPTEPPTVEPTDPLPTEEPTEEPTGEPTTEPTGEPTTEPTGEPTGEPTTEPTVEPTVEPTGEPTDDPCAQNVPPLADANGPYQVMMGKGQAVVNFDGSASSDSDGSIEGYEWDFGDDSAPDVGVTVTHVYTSTGQFVAMLTVTDNCGATDSATADVTITNAVPPTVTVTPPPTVEPGPGEATFGFCHLVQHGQTMSGLAWYYGVPLNVLAAVNGVGVDYYVVAGQGLFIPMTQYAQGPNVYEALPGDTLYRVAWQCGLTPDVLASANSIDPGAMLMPGQQLVIPRWRDVYP